MVVPCSYGIPLISLVKVWKQERRLGISWKERTDYDRSEWERDWYLDCDLSLIHIEMCIRDRVYMVLQSRRFTTKTRAVPSSLLYPAPT